MAGGELLPDTCATTVVYKISVYELVNHKPKEVTEQKTFFASAVQVLFFSQGIQQGPCSLEYLQPTNVSVLLLLVVSTSASVPCFPRASFLCRCLTSHMHAHTLTINCTLDI
jgi:hypothetical protein